jgi:hypothetical protein
MYTNWLMKPAARMARSRVRVEHARNAVECRMIMGSIA